MRSPVRVTSEAQAQDLASSLRVWQLLAQKGIFSGCRGTSWTAALQVVLALV